MTRRAGIVALVGAPNAGKSTLLNSAVGTKLAIVTHKVQTTRALLRGIAQVDESQIVFVDTPGIFLDAKRPLERAMVKAAWSAVADADLVVFLYDCGQARPQEETLALLEELGVKSKRLVLVLNKIDQVKRESLLELAAFLSQQAKFERVFMVAAINGDGVGDLCRWLATALPEGPWLYPEDQLSDLPQRLLAAEVTREKLFLQLHEEVPYALTVETDAWEGFQDGSVKISQSIFVERQGQKKIVIGAGGATIKRVRQAAQHELSAQLGHKVHLFLFVKVRERWQQDPERYRLWGLEPG